MKESRYQADIIRRLERTFPGCIVLKNDSAYIQGIPDLVMFFGPFYAMLEVKVSRHSPNQPNQAFYIDRFNQWSFGAFIYPENEERVFDELQHTLSDLGEARFS